MNFSPLIISAAAIMVSAHDSVHDSAHEKTASSQAKTLSTASPQFNFDQAIPVSLNDHPDARLRRQASPMSLLNQMSEASEMFESNAMPFATFFFEPSPSITLRNMKALDEVSFSTYLALQTLQVNQPRAIGKLFSNIFHALTDPFISDGEVGSFSQGNVGICWILAGILALSHTVEGAQIIRDSISKNNDGSHSVNFSGDYFSKTYQVSQKDLSNENIYGDVDVAILVEAARKMYSERIIHKNINNGGRDDFLKTLSNTKPQATWENLGYFSTNLKKWLLNRYDKNPNVSMYLGTKAWKGIKLKGRYGHALAIIGLNPKKNTITYINPWVSGWVIREDLDKFCKTQNQYGKYIADYSGYNYPHQKIVKLARILPAEQRTTLQSKLEEHFNQTKLTTSDYYSVMHNGKGFSPEERAVAFLNIRKKLNDNRISFIDHIEPINTVINAIELAIDNKRKSALIALMGIGLMVMVSSNQFQKHFRATKEKASRILTSNRRDFTRTGPRTRIGPRLANPQRNLTPSPPRRLQTPFGLINQEPSFFGSPTYRRNIKLRSNLRPKQRPKLSPKLRGGFFQLFRGRRQHKNRPLYNVSAQATAGFPNPSINNRVVKSEQQLVPSRGWFRRRKRNR